MWSSATVAHLYTMVVTNGSLGSSPTSGINKEFSPK